MTVSEFTAVTDCPKCGHIATHWIENPRTNDHESWREYNEAFTRWQETPKELILMECWGGGSFSRQYPIAPKPPADESMFSSMRVCRVCEHRWGQK